VPGHRLTGKVRSCLETRMRAGATSPGHYLGPREHGENPGRQRPVHAQVSRSPGFTRDLRTPRKRLVSWIRVFPRRKEKLGFTRGERGCVVSIIYYKRRSRATINELPTFILSTTDGSTGACCRAGPLSPRFNAASLYHRQCWPGPLDVRGIVAYERCLRAIPTSI